MLSITLYFISFIVLIIIDLFNDSSKFIDCVLLLSLCELEEGGTL
jgi:hypothetical protein